VQRNDVTSYAEELGFKSKGHIRANIPNGCPPISSSFNPHAAIAGIKDEEAEVGMSLGLSESKAHAPSHPA
jgi:hypothetical protein